MNNVINKVINKIKKLNIDKLNIDKLNIDKLNINSIESYLTAHHF